MRINQSVGSAKMTYFVDATSAEAAKKLVIAQRKRAFNEAHGRVPEAYVVLGKVNDYGVVENGARRD
jgi:predicted DNA-binding WGR domain protein